MGGIGSERHWPNKKVLITDCRKLDVLELNRAGALKAGTIGRISWSVDEDDQVSFVIEPKAPPITYQRHFSVNSTLHDSQ